jgi:hypothetical protein
MKVTHLPADIAEITLFGVLTIGTFLSQYAIYATLAEQHQFGIALGCRILTTAGAWCFSSFFRRSVDRNDGLLSWLARLILAAIIFVMTIGGLPGRRRCRRRGRAKKLAGSRTALEARSTVAPPWGKGRSTGGRLGSLCFMEQKRGGGQEASGL